MARNRSLTTRVATTKLSKTRLARSDVTRTLRHRDVARLVQRIVEKERGAGKADVAARVEIGGLLLQLRGRLPVGEWVKWLNSDVPFSARTPQRYIHLHEWADTHVVNYPRLAPLGVSKLYLLSTIPPATLAVLVKTKYHRIPGSGARRTLESMTYAELLGVVHARSSAPELLPAERARQDYERQIKRLTRATATLIPLCWRSATAKISPASSAPLPTSSTRPTEQEPSQRVRQFRWMVETPLPL